MKRVLIPVLALGLGVVVSARWEWTPQTSGVSARLRGLSAVSETVAWSSGSGNTILRTDDGGTTWTKLPSPSPDRLDFRDIDAIDAKTAYALSIGNGAASRIYKTTDAGATWTEQYRANDEKIFLDAMTFSDPNHGIVLGDSIDGKFFFMTTDNGGGRWIPVPIDRLPAALPNEGFFAASGTNVAVMDNRIWIGTGAGPKARVLRSADRGVTWAIAETPIAAGQSAGIYSIAFRDAQHGIVVGGDYAKEAEAVDNCAITSDGGATWTLVKGLGGFRSVVAPVPGTKSTWIAIGPRGGDMSSDDGKTWSPMGGPGLDTFSFIRGKGIGWGSGARGIIAKFVAG